MPNFAVELSVYERGRKLREYDLITDINGVVSLENLLKWTKTALITTADKVLGDEQARGFDKKPVVTVDGSNNKPIASVHPLGKIVFSARQQMSKILTETYQALWERSKVDTGRYKQSHYVFHNGKQIATSPSELEAWVKTNPNLKNNDKIRFVNIQPYARKLERYGITAQRSKQVRREKKRKGVPTGKFLQIPNGTYALTTRAIKAKYKTNTGIKFEFISGGSLGLTASFAPRKKKDGSSSPGRPYLYPSILFIVNEQGVL